VISESTSIVSRYLQQRVLLLSLVLLALLFAVTASLSRTYHLREEGLAAEWSTKGNADLAAGNPARAFEDFRNALSYGPENALVQQRLAEALLADGRLTEARSYLVNLWDRAPGSGQVNLDLAHVTARMGDVDQAIRYFRGAIFGSWENDPALQRRRVRLELCEFLLTRRMTGEAQAEIAGLAADTSAESGALREENGRLYLRAGDPGKALSEFEAALRTNPRQSEWLADAGRAAYESGDYLKAEGDFARADHENPSDEIRDSLALVRNVLGNDPFLAGLSDEEQSRRTWLDFERGLERLRECTATAAGAESAAQPQSDLQLLAREAKDSQNRISLSALGKNPELRNGVMQLVFRIEDATARTCGPGTAMDRALTLIEKRHEGNNS
jgi:tetratricopeptide (TPR) repeat protein